VGAIACNTSNLEKKVSSSQLGGFTGKTFVLTGTQPMMTREEAFTASSALRINVSLGARVCDPQRLRKAENLGTV
jgi:NAD-dependent DNA ligase